MALAAASPFAESMLSNAIRWASLKAMPQGECTALVAIRLIFSKRVGS